MKISVNYTRNLFLSSLKSRGLSGTIRRAWRKRLYALRGLPAYVNIEISNRCNLTCPFCSASRDLMSEEGRDLGFSEFKSIIDQLTQKKNYIPNLQLAVRGEPFMNRQAGQIISYAKEKGLYVLINTNGLLLNPRLSTALIEAGLDMIIISIDGATKDTYESMRKGGDFDTLLKNIRDLVKQKKGRGARLPFVELQCIVSRKNERELEKMNKLALSLGVDNLRFKSYKVTCFDRDAGSIESLKKDLPDSLKYRRYLIKGGVLQPRSLPRVCSWANDLIVYSNADVGACCEDFDKKYTCGNILRDGLWKVLHSKQRGQLKQKICKRELEICKTCS